MQDDKGVYGQYVLKQFSDFINAFPQGQGLATIGYPLSPVVATQVNIKGVPTWVLVQAFQRRVLTLNVLNPQGSQVEFGNIGQHYYTWRYASNA